MRQNLLPFLSVCDAVLDVALLIDRSGSVGDQFPVFLRYIVEFIEGFRVGQNRSRFGGVIFNETARVAFSLEEITTFEEYNSTITSLDGPGGLTNLADASRVTRTELLGALGDRPDVPNVCILFTDGFATREQNNTEDEAALLRQNCTIITVSVGNFTDEMQLRAISTNNRFFSVLNFDMLSTIRDRLTGEVCSLGSGETF